MKNTYEKYMIYEKAKNIVIENVPRNFELRVKPVYMSKFAPKAHYSKSLLFWIFYLCCHSIKNSPFVLYSFLKDK